MNTPIQEAIEQIEEIQDNWKDNSEVWNAYQVTINILTKLLEDEKQVIIDAFQEGYKDFERRVEKYDEFQDYYTQNFSNDAEIK